MALIIPEVFASLVNDKLGTTLKAGQVSFDATPLINDITNFGSTIHFPVLSRVATAQVVTKGTPIVPATIDNIDSEATVKQVASSVTVYDIEAAQLKADSLMDKMSQQVTDAFAKQVDSDLIAEMATNSIFNTTAATQNVVTFDELLEALDAFGDSRDTDSYAGILTSSKVFNSLLGMDAFVSTAMTFNTANGRANGVVQSGLVGHFMGIPCFISNQTVDGTGKTRTFIVKKNSLGYIWQKNMAVEIQREGLLLANHIICSGLYAVKLVDTSGVSVLS